MQVYVKALVLCGACLLAAARPVSAEWHLTPMLGWEFKGNTTIVDLEDATSHLHWQVGGATTVLGGGIIGAEAIFVYIPGFFERGDLTFVKHSRSLALMGNAVLTVPRRWTEYWLRPFVSGGLGLLHASVTNNIDGFPVKTNLLGFDLGGGAVGFISKRTGLRFDLRYYSNLHHSEPAGISFGRVHLRYLTASVGVVLRR